MGDAKNAASKEEMHCWGVGFACDGKEFACCTSHGVFVYKVHTQNCQGQGGDFHNSALERFVPQMLTENVTTSAILGALEKKERGKAMILALALNDFNVLLKVFESVPVDDVPSLLTSIGPTVLPALINFLAQCLHPTKGTKHLQFILTWVEHLLDLHLGTLLSWQGERTIDINYSKGDVVALLLQLLQRVTQQHQSLQSVFRNNMYALEFLAVSQRQKDAERE